MRQGLTCSSLGRSDICPVQEIAATRISTNSVFGGPSAGLISGGVGSYYFALFVGPVSVTNVPSGPAPYDPTLYGFTFTGDIGTNTANAGRFNGNPGTDMAVVPGYAIGSSANFTVVGWSSNIGRTWAEAETSLNYFFSNASGPVFWGNSQVATGIQLGGGILPFGYIFGANPGQITGFTLQMQVPEPSSLSFLGLALGLYVFRLNRGKSR